MNDMKTIILAGGFGTRLKSEIPDVPKPMAPVSGRPFLQFILDQLVSQDITDIILSTGHLGHIIQNHFGTIYRNAKIGYFNESKPLGTGGALLNIFKNEAFDAPVIIINGDTFLQIDYEEFQQWNLSNGFKMSIALKPMQDCSRYGSVQQNNKTITKFSEKGASSFGLINAGVYVVEPNIFKGYNLPDVFSFESDFLQKYLLDLTIGGYISDSYFLDIGTPDDYKRAQNELPALPLLSH